MMLKSKFIFILIYYLKEHWSHWKWSVKWLLYELMKSISKYLAGFHTRGEIMKIYWFFVKKIFHCNFKVIGISTHAMLVSIMLIKFAVWLFLLQNKIKRKNFNSWVVSQLYSFLDWIELHRKVAEKCEVAKLILKDFHTQSMIVCTQFYCCLFLRDYIQRLLILWANARGT